MQCFCLVPLFLIFFSSPDVAQQETEKTGFCFYLYFTGLVQEGPDSSNETKSIEDSSVRSGLICAVKKN